MRGGGGCAPFVILACRCFVINTLGPKFCAPRGRFCALLAGIQENPAEDKPFASGSIL